MANINTSENQGNVILLDFNCNCTNLTLDNILNKYSAVYINNSKGYNIKFNSNIHINKNSSLFLDSLVLNNNIVFNNDGMLYLKKCTLNGYDLKHIFFSSGLNSDPAILENNGQCILENCIISDNKCDNILENKRIMVIINSTVKNNHASKYGVIYNNGGVLNSFNTTFLSNKGEDIYNFQIGDCVLINSNYSNVVFDKPLSNLQMDLIQT